MPIEKILTRSLAALLVFFIIIALKYSPSYSMPAFLLLLVCVAADLLMPSRPQTKETKTEKVISKILIIQLALVVVVGFVALLFLWKLASSGKFG